MRTENTKANSITKSDMKTKRLGNSDLAITPIGFGAWAIGGSGWEFGWGDQDDKASIAAIHRALELGVNWIDTAAVYGMGHSEEVVASALKIWPGPRPYVFTKCGLRWDKQGYVHNNLQAKSIRRECEDSLRRLNVDRIDLYQIHWPTSDLARRSMIYLTNLSQTLNECEVLRKFRFAEFWIAAAPVAIGQLCHTLASHRAGLQTGCHG